jgi:hypothetical protein
VIPSFVTLFISILFIVPGYFFLSRLGISKRLTDLQLVLRGMPLSLLLHIVYTLPFLLWTQNRIVGVIKAVNLLRVTEKTFASAPDEYLAIFRPHLWVIILFIVGLFLATYCLTVLAHKVLARFAFGMDDRTDRTMLHELLWAYRKGKSHPVVQISLKNGTTYCGVVVIGSYELTEEVLLHPYSVLTEDGIEEHFDDYLYLKLAEATHIQFFDSDEVLGAHINDTQGMMKSG